MKKTIYLLAILAFMVPALTFASFDVSLKYGSKGDAVSELQDFLTDQNVYTGKVDGKFGFGTLKAVKAFQTANNLPVDGYFGRASRKVAQTLLAADLKTSDDAEQAETGSISPAVTTMSGCTSIQGFSTTTGHPCDPSTPSPVTDSGTQSAISALTQQVQTQTQVQQQIAQNTAPVVSTPAPVNLNPDGVIMKIRGVPTSTLNIGETQMLQATLYNSDGITFYPSPSYYDWGEIVRKDNSGAQVDDYGNPIVVGNAQKGSSENFVERKAGIYTVTFNLPKLGLSQSATVTVIDPNATQ